MNLTHLWSSLNEFSKRNIDKRITLAASITSIVVFKGPVPLRMKSQIPLRMAIWGRARDWDSVVSNLDPGSFPLNQNFPKFGNGGKSYRNFPEKFPEFRKLLNFRIGRHSTENSRFSGSKVEWKENFREKNFENLGIPCAVALFLEILENAVPLAPGSCRKFKPDALVEWKAPPASSAISW